MRSPGFRAGLVLAVATAAGLPAGCGKGDKQSVVLVNVTAAPPLSGAHDVDVTVGGVTRTFSASGLGATAVGFGVIIAAEVNGHLPVTVAVRTQEGGCTLHRGTGSVDVPAGHKGAVFMVGVSVNEASPCGADAGPLPDGAPPSPGPDGGLVPDAPGADGPTADGPPSADGPRETPPPVTPPSLTRCTVYTHGPMDCGLMVTPYQTVTAIFSPDGKQLVSAGQDNGIKFWKVSAGALLGDDRVLTSDGRAVVEFSPDGTHLAAGALNGQLVLHDLRDFTKQDLVGLTQRVRGLGFKRDGTRLVAVDLSRTLAVWDLTAGTAGPALASIPLPAEPWAMAVAQTNPPGEFWVAVAMGVDQPVAGVDAGAGLPPGGHVYLVNVNAPAMHTVLTLDTTTEQGGIMAVAISPDGNFLAAGGVDSVVKVWNISNRLAPTKVKDLAPVMLTNGSFEEVSALAYSPDGRFLAAGYGGFYRPPRLRMFDMTTFAIRNERDPEIWEPSSAAFSPAGNSLAVGSWNCNIFYYCQD